jgi:hypothetical protein
LSSKSRRGSLGKPDDSIILRPDRQEFNLGEAERSFGYCHYVIASQRLRDDLWTFSINLS